MMSEFMDNVQDQIKRGSKGIFTLFLRFCVGFFLSVTLSLAAQIIWGYKDLVFWFVVAVMTGLFLRISQRWTSFGVGIFLLICVLIGLLLRLYIVVAPGS
jgi:hypothetical protein